MNKMVKLNEENLKNEIIESVETSDLDLQHVSLYIGRLISDGWKIEGDLVELLQRLSFVLVEKSTVKGL